MKYSFYTALFGAVVLYANDIDLKNTNLYNETAFIPPQCYTKTTDDNGIKHNPCYACHTKSTEPNYTNDDDLQETYSFPEYATKNRWINLFKDRTKQIINISDKEILNYIQKDNYKDKNNNIILSQKLKNIPKNWDANNNGKWDGIIPDCNFNFDEKGFDRDDKNLITGWRAFGYYPFLGTFWPTNGSTDDVMIRLPKLFWKDKKGNISLSVYEQNLDIVERLIKQKKEQRPTSYVGLASTKNLKIASGLYPVGTEFLHSVRYIDVKDDEISMSKRMKELRYAKKLYWANYNTHQDLAEEEMKETSDFPDRYSVYNGDIEQGLSNKRGWTYQGFIEDKNGELRPQSYEETLFCMGCHSSIGAITDSTFSFPRKFEHTLNNGWYDWSKKGLKGIIDKNDEYLKYLKNNNHANEFRDNIEVYNKFFKDGKLNTTETSKIQKDISYLLFPSAKRAITLNKAYKVIVDEQSFIYGRDGHIKPINSVHKQTKEEQSTKLEIVE
ncbi:MAG: hypothetical protein WBG69_09345 [Arcobacteraceae bacterium]